jgi:histidinol phosphatase-like enzyme (inositol monophosphatase family)
MHFERELTIARRIVTRSADLSMKHFEAGIEMEDKSDDSPVTNADREAEVYISAALEEAFPEDGQMGEEGVAKPSRSGRTWIIDPIDGTRDFIRGNAQWGVLLGLEADGKPAAGVAHFPVMGKTYMASVGGGAWCNDRRIQVSAVDRLDRAVLCFNGMQNNRKWAYRDIVLDFISKFWCMRSMSGSPDIMMVASGQADVWIEPSAKPWDLCPMKVIVEEAGGKFFNFDGTDSIYAGNALVCTPAFEQLLRDTFVRKP